MKKGLKRWGLVLGILGAVCLAAGNGYVKKYSNPKILPTAAAAGFAGDSGAEYRLKIFEFFRKKQKILQFSLKSTCKNQINER